MKTYGKKQNYWIITKVNMSTVYENEIEQLIKFQNNKFPNSLIFSGNEVEIIRKIVITLAYVVVNNSKIDSKYNFEQLITSSFVWL